MRKLGLILIAASTAGCMAQAPMGAEMTAAAETAIAAETTGLTRGTPVDCIDQRGLAGPRAIAPGVLVFEGGGMLYINRSLGTCGDVNSRAVTFRSSTGRLCRGDVGQSFDPLTNIQGDFCTLGMFEPYRRR